MFKVAVAHSAELDSREAAREVMDRCAEQLDGAMPNAGLLFAATVYDNRVLLDEINARYPGLELIGCTTDGEMSGEAGYAEDSVTLTLFHSDEVAIAAGIGLGNARDSAAAAAAALDIALSGLAAPPCLVLTLPDGLTTAAFEFLAGLGQKLGSDVPVVGGMSADQVTGSKTTYETRQFFKTEPFSDATPLLVFAGPLRYSLGVQSGWTPLGKIMRVTRVTHTVVHELDGRPAFEMYRHYLGNVFDERISGLGAYPLAVYEEGSERYYLRVAREADPATGAMTFLAEVPAGAVVQITHAVRNHIIEGASASAREAMRRYSGESPAVAMLFSCTGRKLALGSKTREEVACVRESLPAATPICGFYTFGEICPVAGQTATRYHNATFVTLPSARPWTNACAYSHRRTTSRAYPTAGIFSSSATTNSNARDAMSGISGS